MHRQNFRVVFAGRTSEEEKIALYVDREDRFHISVNDGDLQALNVHLSKLEWWFNHKEARSYCTIQSPQWTGTAMGYSVLDTEDS